MKTSRAKCRRGTVKHEQIPLLNPEAALLLRKKGRSTHLLHKVVEVKTCLDKGGDLVLKMARVKKGRPSRMPMAFDPDITPPGLPRFSPVRTVAPMRSMPASFPSPRPAPPITPSSMPTPPVRASPRRYAAAPPPRSPPPGIIVGGAAASGEPMRRLPVMPGAQRVSPPRPRVRASPALLAPVSVTRFPSHAGIGPRPQDISNEGISGLGCSCTGKGLGCTPGLGCECPDGGLSCGCCR